MLSSRMSSEPMGAVLEVKGAEWGCVWGMLNSGAHGHVVSVPGDRRHGWVGGRQRGMPALCLLQLRCCLQRSWSVAHPGTGHGARCWQAAQLHEPCHGGHSRRNVWGKYRSFCSWRHAGECSIVLKRCLYSL